MVYPPSTTTRSLLLLSFYNHYHIQIDKFLLDKNILPSSTSDLIATCPGFLPYCPAIDFIHNPIESTQIAYSIKYWLRRTLLRPFVCLRCKYKTQNFLSDYRHQFYRVFPYRFLLKSFLYLIKISLNHSILQTKLSEAIEDNTISCYLVSNRCEINDIQTNFNLACFIAARHFHQLYIDFLFNYFSPSHVLTFNGRMLPHRLLLNKSNSIPKVPCLIHERGFENSSFVFKLNEPAHSRQQLFDYLETNSNSILQRISLNTATKWAAKFYKLRSVGHNIDCQMPAYDITNLDPIYKTSSPLIVFI